jgi:tetratricopeptide (TPR) repeat protein
LRFFKEADDKEHIAECLFNMADAQMKNGLVFEAIETFRQCREIAQRVGNRELTSKVEGVLAQAEKFGVLSDPESAHGDKLRPGFAPATGAFSQLLSRIEVALSSEDIEMAERLLWSAGECASEQGMMGHVHLKQKQSAGSRDPSRIIEMGIMISVLIEDTGHKEKRMDFVTSAEQFLQLLMRYAELATCANALGYRALKDGLKLQITSGAYYGAAVVVELAFVTSKTVSALEAISMCNNRAAIQLKLGNLVKAEALFSQALSLMAGHVPQELRGAITRNLKGVRTGYDPDFLFLPD